MRLLIITLLFHERQDSRGAEYFNMKDAEFQPRVGRAATIFECPVWRQTSAANSIAVTVHSPQHGRIVDNNLFQYRINFNFATAHGVVSSVHTIPHRIN